MKLDRYQEFREKLILRGFATRSAETYVRAVDQLVEHYTRLPEAITDDELHDYLIYLFKEKHYAPKTMITRICGIRHYYRLMHRRSMDCIEQALPVMKTPVRLPQFYSAEEVQQLLTVKGIQMKQMTMLMTTYSTGMRVREVCRLKITDILSSRLQIRVEQGKGNRERYTVLSPKLLNILRNYWRIYKPRSWLFPNPANQDKPLDKTSLYRTFRQALELAGLPNRGGIHSLRHSFATHAFESGVDLPTLQSLLGHQRLMATTVYIHVSRSRLLQATSPLDLLDFKPKAVEIGTDNCTNNLHKHQYEDWPSEEPD